MIWRIAANGIRLLFAGALIANAIFIARILVARNDLNSMRAEYRAGNSQAVPFTAYDANGTRVDIGNIDAGLAVWYASSRCVYCQNDEEWRRLAQRLHEKGVRVVTVLPGPVDVFPDAGVTTGFAQVAYVDPTWLARYPLSVTPTLLLFDRNHNLVWHKWGMLGADDPPSALSVLEGLAAPVAGR
jgi:hypothetical protein